ncbi:MAG: hypothetical protein WBP45_11055 [Daejeonella sp.]
MLFNSSDIKDFQQPQNKEASLTKVEGGEMQLLIRANDTLLEKFPGITQGISYHYATAGLWSSHDLLFHLLTFTGPAKVYLATWSITEDPARMLVNGLNNGIIQELYGLFDIRVKIRSPETYLFAKHNLCKARLTVCHAKVTIIQNENWNISIVGSANYTNNPRIEAGVISTLKATAEFHKDWILKELDKAHPFDI